MEDKVDREEVDDLQQYPDNIPYSLNKATCDPFDYALGLRDGTIIRFQEAQIKGEWVSLTWPTDAIADFGIIKGPLKALTFNFERGVEIRLSEIIWCCDAPCGS